MRRQVMPITAGDEYAAADHTCPRRLRPAEVLDLHADLHRYMAHLSGRDRLMIEQYGREDARYNMAWAPSHLNPATDLRDLSPWVNSLGADLFGATTYQVTEEMIDTAEGLTVTTPDLGDLVEEDLPSDWGFAWFDRPIPRPSAEDKPGQQPLLMHAVSWARIPRIPIDIRVRAQGEGEPEHLEGPPHQAIPFSPVKKVYVPAVRIREWGWYDDPEIRPRPLHLIGQSTAILTPNVHTPMTQLHLVHMIWILMGMEITASTRETPGRHGRKRAANLKQQEVTVITLRRHSAVEPGNGVRHVDWTCTWLVRGHWRKAPRGGTYADGRTRTWIKPYIKGPEGLPLRASDILYKLAR